MESSGQHGPALTAPHDASPPAASTDSASEATVLSRGEPPRPPSSVAELGALLEGRRLGIYRLDQFIGGGGMGAVFRALDTTLERDVAVKVLARHQSADEEMLRRFRNEAQSAARLNHENIGRVHAVGSEAGWHFIVFEYIEGTNLRDLIQAEGPLSVAATVDVTMQITDALEHAARRDVVHRDIKPSNILITPTGRAKLVDMGLARLHHITDEHDLTVSGMTLGTFDYISPEQARDARAADMRSDLYSLGCTMFYMLAGRPPFAEGTMVQKLLQHQQEPPPPIEAIRADVPKPLAAIIRRLMEKDPADRYERPAALLVDLLGLAEAEGLEVSVGRPVLDREIRPHRPRRSRILPWAVPVAGLVVLVVATWLTGVRSSRLASTSVPVRSLASSPTLMPVVPVAPEPPDIQARIFRVVAAPQGPLEVATLTEALAAAEDGDVIELGAVRERVTQSLVIGGRSLTIRAAAPDGERPVIRFAEPEGSEAAERVGWSVDGGRLLLEGVSILFDRSSLPAEIPVRESVFLLTGSAAVDCRDVEMVVIDDPAIPFQSLPTLRAAAVMRVAAVRDGSPPKVDGLSVGSGAHEIRLSQCTIGGDAVLLDVGSASRTRLSWTGGGLTTSGRFLVADGAPRGGGPTSIELELGQATFACGSGFALLLDSLAHAAVPRLRATVRECRFLISDEQAFLEQSGIAEAEDYEQAVVWLDDGSEYEGTNVYRRIDGATERIDLDFAAPSQPRQRLQTEGP
jgi:serine/threonine protein kinase